MYVCMYVHRAGGPPCRRSEDPGKPPGLDGPDRHLEGCREVVEENVLYEV